MVSFQSGNLAKVLWRIKVGSNRRCAFPGFHCIALANSMPTSAPTIKVPSRLKVPSRMGGAIGAQSGCGAAKGNSRPGKGSECIPPTIGACQQQRGSLVCMSWKKVAGRNCQRKTSKSAAGSPSDKPWPKAVRFPGVNNWRWPFECHEKVAGLSVSWHFPTHDCGGSSAPVCAVGCSLLYSLSVEDGKAVLILIEGSFLNDAPSTQAHEIIYVWP
jgi:hypothetical protein